MFKSSRGQSECSEETFRSKSLNFTEKSIPGIGRIWQHNILSESGLRIRVWWSIQWNSALSVHGIFLIQRRGGEAASLVGMLVFRFP